MNKVNVREFIKITPNPSKGEMSIIIEDFDMELLNLELYDIHGSLFYTETVSSNIVKLSDIPKGIFILNLSNSRRNYVEKIIVQ